MNGILVHQLESSVRSLCPLISTRVSSLRSQAWSGEDMLSEVLCCVLSSQVPYEMAQCAVSRIRENGLLSEEHWRDDSPEFESMLCKLLLAPMKVGGRLRKYRFPVMRAKQIRLTRDTLLDQAVDLAELVFQNQAPKALRKELTRLVHGLGLKQASMFLRNVGRSYDLAILDRHTLRYMVLQRLIPSIRSSSLSFTQYESIERAMEDYAAGLGFPVGYVDWAIWITMRAAGVY